jgi:hypothetical protein
MALEGLIRPCEQFVGLANANSKDLGLANKGKAIKADDAIKFKNILLPDLIRPHQFFAIIATDENYNLNC